MPNKTYSEFVNDLTLDTPTGDEKVALVDGSTTKYTTLSSVHSLYVFNVKAYGATGDGVTDDTIAFENAYTDLVSAGGGTIYVPSGTYIVDGLVFVTSNFTFEGEGQSTIIKLKANANTDVICDGDAVTSQENVHYRNFKIDGNKSNQPISGTGLPGAERCGLRLRHDAQNVYNVTVENVYAYNTRHNGISVESTNACVVTRCRSEYNDNYGIWWENGNEVTITNNYTSHNTLAGIKVLSAAEGSIMGNQSKSDRGSSYSFQSVGRISIVGNKSYRAGWHYDGTNDEAAIGFNFSACDSCTVLGNTVFGSQGDGFTINGTTNSSFGFNNFQRNGQITNDTYSDILITNTGGGSNNTNNIFFGNTIKNDTDGFYPNVTKYNVNFAQTNVHLGNSFAYNVFGTPGTAKTNNFDNTDGTPEVNNNTLEHNINLNPHKYFNYGYLDPSPFTIDPKDGNYLVGSGYNSSTTVNIADGISKGQKFTFQFNQDTGNKLIVWGSSVRWSGGVAPTLNTDSSGFDVFEFAWDGTYWNGVVSNLQPAIHAQGSVTGSTTFNRVNGSTITATLTGNVTATITDGVIAGDTLTLILTQDGTGSRTITWPSNFKKASGTLTLSTAAGAIDVIEMQWDGTNWREVSRSMELS